MKYIYLLFISILVHQFISAQYLETHNHNSLVNAHDLGDDLLLFIPDTTTRILINPARAAVHDQTFIYTNYNPGGSAANFLPRISSESIYIEEEVQISFDNTTIRRRRPVFLSRFDYFTYSSSAMQPDFSTIALFHALGSKWLFNFSHSISHSKEENERENTGSDIYSFDVDYYTTIINSLYAGNRNTENSNTVLVLSKIGVSGIGNYSFGLFGSYNQSKSRSLYNDYSYAHSLNFTDYYNRNQRMTSSSYNNRIEKNYFYQIGMSYSLSTENSDFIGRISYQKADILENIEDNDISVRIDSTTCDTIPGYLLIRKNKVIHNSQLDNEYKPGSYLFHNYYQRKLNWMTKNDHIFLKVSGFYSSNDKKYMYNEKFSYESYSTETTNEYSSTGDTITSKYYGSRKMDNWAIDLATGYMMTFSLSEIFVLTGLNPMFQIIHLEDVNADVSILQDMNEVKSLFFKLPVYLSYSPRKWIEIYGGFNYYYTFHWQQREYEYISKRVRTPDREQNITRKMASEYNSIRSSRDTYLGLNLRHKSGLRCMLYFTSDIMYYKNWNISIGYHF